MKDMELELGNRSKEWKKEFLAKKEIRIYRKIMGEHNVNPEYDWLPKKGDTVIVEEKLDGSNLTIAKVNGDLRLFSRNKEITNNMETFKGLAEWLKSAAPILEKVIPEHFSVHGEWIGMGKIKYNVGDTKRWFIFDTSIYDKAEICPILLEGSKYFDSENFDIFKSEIPQNDYFDFVPIIKKSIIFESIDKITKDCLTKNSLLDPHQIMEGIIIRGPKSEKFKIVSKNFKEFKPKKNQKKQNDTAIKKVFIDCLTPARIEKYKQRLAEEKQDSNDTKVLFKNSVLLFEDIWEEMQEHIKKAIKKDTNKLIFAAIRENIKKD